MNLTNESAATSPEPDFAAFLAIDWADRKHYWKLRIGEKTERGTLDHTPEAIDEWVAQLDQRFGGRPIAVAMEQRHGALAVMLGKYHQFYLYPVHPVSLARYREAWYPSRSKDDIKDADLLCEMLAQHRDRLRRLEPDTEDMRLLQMHVQSRRRLVDERTALSNRLKDTLKIYYPQIPFWHERLTTELALDLLTKWPTLEALQKARTNTVEKFLREHRMGEQEAQQRIAAIRSAVAATRDRAVIEAAVPLVRVWVAQIRVLNEGIRGLEKAIRELAGRQEDWTIVSSFPGAGEALAPRLMAALGSLRHRFESADELQCFSGIAPVKIASGRSVVVQARKACPQFIRQTFHEWAACSIPECEWARCCYEQMRKRGQAHHQAVRGLAFKWIRILYRCWTQRIPYSEETYLASLARRNTPFPPAVQIP